MTDSTSLLPTVPAPGRLLTAEAFQRLADVPPELEWFANLGSPATRRAYEHALADFMRFAGLGRPEEFRSVTRSHVIAWRDDLLRRALSGMTVRHRLAALSSLFEYLCEKNAVTHNPVKGVKRPAVEGYEGKTPALGDHQARALLDAPAGVSVKGKRDRAILATLLYHALRRDELCQLTSQKASVSQTRGQMCHSAFAGGRLATRRRINACFARPAKRLRHPSLDGSVREASLSPPPDGNEGPCCPGAQRRYALVISMRMRFVSGRVMLASGRPNGRRQWAQQ